MKKAVSGTFNCFFDRIRTRKFRLVFFSLYIIFTVFSAVWFMAQGMARNSLLSVAYFSLFIVMLPVFEYFLSMDCGNIFILVLFSVPIGGLLGTCYDFYMLIPFFDTLLHGISGFVFAAVGYSIMDRILRAKGPPSYLASILFALCFSLAIAVLWELFEWLLSVTMKVDMHEDSVVGSIRSYYFSGTHEYADHIQNIEKSIIVYDAGKVLTVDKGYLDLGLVDTLTDMLVCLVGAIIFTCASVVACLRGEGAMRHLAPFYTKRISELDLTESGNAKS